MSKHVLASRWALAQGSWFGLGAWGFWGAINSFIATSSLVYNSTLAISTVPIHDVCNRWN